MTRKHTMFTPMRSSTLNERCGKLLPLLACLAAALVLVAGAPAQEKDGKDPNKKETPQPVNPGKPVIPSTGQPTRPPTRGSTSLNPPRAPNATPPHAATPQAPPESRGGLGDDGMYTFSAWSEPVDITAVIDFVRQDLDLQLMATDPGLVGQKISLTTPVTMPKDKVLPFIAGLLEQREYTIVQSATGVYVIQPKSDVRPEFVGGPFSPTKIIKTPGIKPSSLQTLISAITTSARGVGGSAPVYMDEIGVIVMTDTPRVTQLVEDTIAKIVAEREEFIIPWKYRVLNISAANARDRILELVGQARPTTGGAAPGPGGTAAPAGVTGATLSNLPERLMVEPGSNALLFKGREDEAGYLERLLSIVDVTPELISRWYPVGIETAEAVAAEGRRQQLGETTTFEPADSSSSSSRGIAPGQASGAVRGVVPGAGSGSMSTADLLGSGFVIYPESGGFMYQGTETQHERVKALILQLADLSERERPVVEFYKLRFAKAEDLAGTVQSVLNSEAQTSSAPLLNDRSDRRRDRSSTGGGTNSRDRSNRDRASRQPQAAAPGTTTAGGPGGSGDTGLGDLQGEDIFVMADEPNNQVVVKAPRRVQPQIKALIDKLDLRRPQVYIDAKIVAISIGDDFRLAVEIQKIIGQFAINTSFGLSGFGDAGSFDGPKSVNTDLPGLTAALIRSKDVPIIITALARNTDSRIVASPQILVDDNSEAEISSEDQQPTLETTIGVNNQNNTQSFGGFEGAGPSLIVTPQISDGGTVKLDYDIVLSSFQGDSVSPGIPPARQENRINSESVTVPSDATIVIGGITFEQTQTIDTGIPLLKDIPILGTLFKDQRKNTRRNMLYVFLTPRIMKDPNFLDVRLNTRGPMADAKIDPDIPAPASVRMEIVDAKPNFFRSAPSPAGERLQPERVQRQEKIPGVD